MIAKQETTYYDVIGIGNAIVDVLAKVGEGFLKERNLPKGGMTLVDAVTAGKYTPILFPNEKFPAVLPLIPLPDLPRWEARPPLSVKFMTTSSVRNLPATSELQA